MNKKVISTLVIGTLIAGTLAGCGGSSDAGSSAKSSSGKTELELFSNKFLFIFLICAKKNFHKT